MGALWVACSPTLWPRPCRHPPVHPGPPPGWRGSFNGDLSMYGKMGVQFYTRTKTVTSSWRDQDPQAAIPGLAGVGASAPGRH